jgi:DNA invertase Pin-like site-specific DNA recombinase
VFGALAEFERALMYERTMAGLAASRARGRVGGRPRALTAAQIAHAELLSASGTPFVKSPRSSERGDRRCTGSYSSGVPFRRRDRCIASPSSAAA